jgi:hypothetical protein
MLTREIWVHTDIEGMISGCKGKDGFESWCRNKFNILTCRGDMTRWHIYNNLKLGISPYTQITYASILFILWAQVKTHVTKFLDPALSNVTTSKKILQNIFFLMRKQLLQHFFCFFQCGWWPICMCRAQSWCHEVCTKFGPQSSFTLFITSWKSIPKRTQDKPRKKFPYV